MSLNIFQGGYRDNRRGSYDDRRGGGGGRGGGYSGGGGGYDNRRASYNDAPINTPNDDAGGAPQTNVS